MMSLCQIQNKWTALKEAIALTFLGGIPNLFLGPALRRLGYRLIFSNIGQAVYIQNGAEFLGTGAIQLDDHVHLCRNVRINARGNQNLVKIGAKTSLQHGADIRALDGSCVEIGAESFIGPYVCIAGPGNIRIGNHCSIASHSGLFANNHKFADPTRTIHEQGLSRKGIVIEDNCWIGHSVTILDGVTIGEGSVVGAGAVVSKTIPPGSVAVGVPAKVISNRYAAAEDVNIAEIITVERLQRGSELRLY